VEKQLRREKLQVIVDNGVTAELAALKEKFEANGYEWDFDKRANRWVKGFLEEAGKAIGAIGGSNRDEGGKS
jgi:hypothetical protein